MDFAESDFDAKGVIFEYFLGQRGKDDLAQYFTPRNIVRFMVNFLEPKLGETVYDPFCGSGGMLIEAYEFIRKQILFDEKYQDNLNFLRKKTLYGNDKASIAYVAKLNMILIGDGHNNIERCDSLKKKARRECDIVITNIPFNISTEFGNLYTYPTSEANSICVQHIIANLTPNPNARAGIIVPNIFVSGDGFQELRKNIEDNFTITVVALPEGTFQPYTPSNAYILFIKRKQLVKWSERANSPIEYYRVQQIGFTLNKKKEPIPKDDLSDVISGKITAQKITQENS
ncbi:MAG: SAM-dependent methyltransferase [Mollicutes bacterium UO1]